MTQTANFYSHSHNKGALLRAGGAELTLVSPTTGKPISVTEVKLQSVQVKDSIVKSIYNRRSWELLTPSAVLDILREIEKDKRNTTPVIAVKKEDGKYEIIAGLRRCFAVSLVPDAQLVMHVAQVMSEEDKAAIAKRADTYKAPSLIDFGLTLKDYKNQIGEGAFTVRGAAEVFGINKTAVSEALRFAELPTEFFKLFPDIEIISRRFLRKLTSKDITKDLIDDVVNHIEAPQVVFGSEDAEIQHDLVKKITADLEKKVLEFLTSKTKTAEVVEKGGDVWSGLSLKKGVMLKQNKNEVSITLPLGLINSELGEKILELLKEG